MFSENLITIQSDSFEYSGSGSADLSGSASIFWGVSAQQSFSWRISGVVEKELESSWRVGDGEYYWYRVEGECGEVTCDNFGVQHRNCKKMTFMTVISARNIAEVCENMQDPVINAPVQTRIISIKRYSRPAGGTADAFDCNVLDDADFCHIPECLDYCVFERSVVDIPIRFFAIEHVFQATASGGILLGGKSENNARLDFIPFYPVVNFVGGCSFSVSYNFISYAPSLLFSVASVSSDGIEISGVAECESTGYLYESSGSVQLSGASQNVSPNWNYPSLDLISIFGENGLEILTESGLSMDVPSMIAPPVVDIILGGGGRIGYFYSADGSAEIGGYSDLLINLTANSSGIIEVGGSVVEISSPYYSYYPSGEILLSGSADLGFEDLGIVLMNMRLASSAFGFGFDFNAVTHNSPLTISQPSVVGTCGCQSVGLALALTHNLLESSVLSGFLERSGTSLPSTLYLRHKSSDSSWRETRRLVGRDETGGDEEISLFFGLECAFGHWRFSFVARSMSSKKETKMVAEMPPGLVCGNNLSAEILAYVSTGKFAASRNDLFYVVTPHSIRPMPREPSRGIDLTVDGVPNGYVVYYDQMGLFNDDYWRDFPLEMSINPASKKEMPVMNLQSIF